VNAVGIRVSAVGLDWRAAGRIANIVANVREEGIGRP
jgi:hypothetical protein